MGNVADSFSAPASYQSKAHFYWLLNDLQLLLTQQNDPYAQIIEQAAALLKLDEPPAMVEVARQCRVSESTLRRLFHQRLQTSPAKYRSESKLQRACTMLVTTDLTIEEIASALHYTDAAYFCRCFASRFGTTPARYRQAHRPVL
jgi:transcriptional regulator GlxA family with amidase domain